MGSEFSNADMVMPTIDDFTYKMLKASVMVGTVDCWNIQITAKDEDIADEYGYLKRIVWIGKKIFFSESEFKICNPCSAEQNHTSQPVNHPHYRFSC